MFHNFMEEIYKNIRKSMHVNIMHLYAMLIVLLTNHIIWVCKFIFIDSSSYVKANFDILCSPYIHTHGSLIFFFFSSCFFHETERKSCILNKFRKRESSNQLEQNCHFEPSIHEFIKYTIYN